MSERLPRFRFSLAALLMLVTAIALTLGYTQWRRQSIYREAELLTALGARVYLSDGLLWPTVKAVEVKNTPPRFDEIQRRSKRIGIDHVSQFIGDQIQYPDGP